MIPQLKTRLTERLDLIHPIVGAPMGGVSGAKLATAISKAGGLGIIGAGYADNAFGIEQLRLAKRLAPSFKVGCGINTWTLRNGTQPLTALLDEKPAAFLLSFGDPAPYACLIKEAGAILICQVGSVAEVHSAIAAGADIIVTQGSEAGGHGRGIRGLMSLLPETRSMIDASEADTLLLGAGGIAGGVGLAAALMLGADGVLMGTRFWASHEAHVDPNVQASVLSDDGDSTERSRCYDIVKQREWPHEFTGRYKTNAFLKHWRFKETELANVLDQEFQNLSDASFIAPFGIPVGEAIGLIDRIKPVSQIIDDSIEEAYRTLSAAGKFLNLPVPAFKDRA